MSISELKIWHSAYAERPNNDKMVLGKSTVHDEIFCIWNRKEQRWERIDGIPINIHFWRKIEADELVRSPKIDWSLIGK